MIFYSNYGKRMIVMENKGSISDVVLIHSDCWGNLLKPQYSNKYQIHLI